MELETLFLVTLHNRAHEGYFRAKCRLSKGEQVVEVTAAELAQLEGDPRIRIIDTSDVEPKPSNQSDSSQGDVVSKLPSDGVTGDAPLLMPSHYAPVITDEIKPSADLAVKAKPSRKKS